MDHVHAQVGQRIVDPTARLPGREAAIGVAVHHHPQPPVGKKLCPPPSPGQLAELRQVVFALDPPHRLADRVDSRQQQAHQEAQNGDDHQHLHEGEAAFSICESIYSHALPGQIHVAVPFGQSASSPKGNRPTRPVRLVAPLQHGSDRPDLDSIIAEEAEALRRGNGPADILLLPLPA